MEPECVANAAVLAAVLEASAEKPGNVSPTKSFEDISYIDFVNAALRSRRFMRLAAERGKAAANGRIKVSEMQTGLIIHDAFDPIRGANVNFGVLLMGIPLAAAAGFGGNLRESLGVVLHGATPEDSIWIYKAMRKCDLGGMQLKDRRLAPLDVFSDSSFDIIRRGRLGPVEIFKRCAHIDRLASEWASNYEISFHMAEKIELELESISRCFLEILAEYPDTFIARKIGMERAVEVSQMARWVLEGKLQVSELDEFLRSEGNAMSPGTTADLIATALFIKLLEREREGK